MRGFVAGFATAVLVLLLGLGALLLTLGSPDPSAETEATPVPRGAQGLERGETWLGDLDLTSAVMAGDSGVLRDVRATGQDVRLTREGVTAGRLTLLATLPYDTAARQIGDVGLSPAGDGRVRLTRDVEIAGRTLPVAAVGTVRAENGLLVIEPDEIDLGGPGFVDGGLSAAVRRLVTIRHPVQGLPPGMTLREVRVDDAGFRARLRGDDVRLGG